MGREISMKKIFLTAILTAIYTCTTVYAAYYPVSIDESTKNGVRTITKSYELNQNDDVTAISKEGFEQNGSFFGAFMRGNKPPVLLGEDKNFSV